MCVRIGTLPESKVNGANMGPSWVLSAPGGPHVDRINIATWAHLQKMLEKTNMPYTFVCVRIIQFFV